MPCHFLEEIKNCFSHSAMIKAVARCRLRWNRLPVLRGISSVWIPLPHPFGRGIDINLHDDFQSDFVCQAQQQVEIVKVVFALLWLSNVPLNPGPNCVETQLLHLRQVLLPEAGRIRSNRLKHRCPCFATAVPYRHREEAWFAISALAEVGLLQEETIA